MADITFRSQVGVDGAAVITHSAGSGLGFYGDGYGVSVPVGQTQSSTWVTNANGTDNTNQYELHNTRVGDPSADVGTATDGNEGQVQVDGGTSKTNLKNLPNYQCPLNIRFTHTDAVKVQNCKLRIFDRNNINKAASGVVTYVFESRHPAVETSVVGLTHRGTAGHYWTKYDPLLDPTSKDTIFTPSPGVSGLNSTTADEALTSKFPNAGVTSPAPTFTGTLHSSKQHDWYAAISAQPTEIGSKTNYGLYFSLEYL